MNIIADSLSMMMESNDTEPTALTVTENGTYTAPTGVFGYSPVTVNVSVIHIGIVDETAYVGDITIL